jgi:lipid-binding SYLF domain-containing protein
MKKFACAAMALVAATSSASGAISASEALRLTTAANVVQALRLTIPDEYWARARCAAVIPELKKAAFIIGGEYGKGVMSCRGEEAWGAPVFMQLAKGSWGFQAGAEQVDVVLLVMNEAGVQKLLRNKVTLGADASIAAGPIGRQGSVGTDAQLQAEMLSYSRAQGLFAGIDLSGGVLRPDDDSNKAVYGADATPAAILARREISAPPEAAAFLRALAGTAAKTADSSSSAAARSASSSQATSSPTAPRTTTTPTTDDDVRMRIATMQQLLDRMIASDNPPPAAGTTGTTADSPGSGGMVTVSRTQLLQLRQQLDSLLAALNRR